MLKKPSTNSMSVYFSKMGTIPPGGMNQENFES
jgi:hypothetical protein